MPPIRSSRKIVFVMIANAASAPPSAIEPVSPMNTSAGNALYQRNPISPPISAARDEREVELRFEAVAGRPERIHAITLIGAEGEERDDPGARGEAVETVGQVDAVRGAGDDEEEQPVPRPRELEVPDPGDVDVRRQVLVPRGEADADRDRAEQEQLPAAVEAERAAVRQLDEVVDEARSRRRQA